VLPGRLCSKYKMTLSANYNIYKQSSYGEGQNNNVQNKYLAV